MTRGDILQVFCRINSFTYLNTLYFFVQLKSFAKRQKEDKNWKSTQNVVLNEVQKNFNHRSEPFQLILCGINWYQYQYHD